MKLFHHTTGWILTTFLLTFCCLLFTGCGGAPPEATMDQAATPRPQLDGAAEGAESFAEVASEAPSSSVADESLMSEMESIDEEESQERSGQHPQFAPEPSQVANSGFGSGAASGSGGGGGTGAGTGTGGKMKPAFAPMPQESPGVDGKSELNESLAQSATERGGQQATPHPIAGVGESDDAMRLMVTDKEKSLPYRVGQHNAPGNKAEAESRVKRRSLHTQPSPARKMAEAPEPAAAPADHPVADADESAEKKDTPKLASGKAETQSEKRTYRMGHHFMLMEEFGLKAKEALAKSPARQKAIQLDIQPGEELWIIAKASDTATKPASNDQPRSGALMATLPGQEQKVPVPLKHTAVEGNVDGYIATVDVTQQFHNPFDSKIEAVYVFPLPNSAAVNEFVMTVGDRKIRGIIQEREKAEKIYAAAKARGHVASLLNQERANIFTQKVANIEPGKKIDINIRYFNTLQYDDGAYEFVFPMVVGPRFNPPATKTASARLLEEPTARAARKRKFSIWLRTNAAVTTSHCHLILVPVSTSKIFTASITKSTSQVTGKQAETSYCRQPIRFRTKTSCCATELPVIRSRPPC